MKLPSRDRIVDLMTDCGLFGVLAFLSSSWRSAGLIALVPLLIGGMGWGPVLALGDRIKLAARH